MGCLKTSWTYHLSSSVDEKGDPVRRAIVVGALLGLGLGCVHAVLQQQSWAPAVGAVVGAVSATSYAYLGRRGNPPPGSEPSDE